MNAGLGRRCIVACQVIERKREDRYATADEFGMCDDRFGITWMVNIGQPQT